MFQTPPPYAEYPRNTAPVMGTSAQLQSLYSAYRNYGWVFLLNIVLAFLIGFVGAATGKNDQGSILFLLGWPILMIVIAAVSYPLNKKIGFGAGWSSAQVVVATILMGLNSVCCGIIGYAIIQQIISGHIKRFGIRTGFFGIRRKAVAARVAKLQAQEGIAHDRWPSTHAAIPLRRAMPTVSKPWSTVTSPSPGFSA